MPAAGDATAALAGRDGPAAPARLRLCMRSPAPGATVAMAATGGGRAARAAAAATTVCAGGGGGGTAGAAAMARPGGRSLGMRCGADAAEHVATCPGFERLGRGHGGRHGRASRVAIRAADWGGRQHQWLDKLSYSPLGLHNQIHPGV